MNATNFLYLRDAFAKADAEVFGGPRTPAWHFEDLAALQEALTSVRNHEKAPKDGFHPDKLDLVSRAQAAPAVLDGMQDDNDAIAELRAASRRPDARYDVKYKMDNPWSTLVPHLARIKQSCQRLNIEACARLALGKSEEALADENLAFYLAATPRTEPFLISYLVDIACVQVAVQPIWEGLAEHRWTDDELQRLQSLLQQYNYIAAGQWSLRAERTYGVTILDLLQKRGLQEFLDLQQGVVSDNPAYRPLFFSLGRICPSGWYDLEKLHVCQLGDEQFEGTMDGATQRVFPARLEDNVQRVTAQTAGVWGPFFRHQLIAKLLIPALSGIPKKAAAVQTAVDEAFVACALERYRLANGHFPDNLDALTPRFADHLPNDVITSEPLKYRLTHDGQFILYSVGWNRTDDGGIYGNTKFDETTGDWVWEYPATNSLTAATP
jgi:hypothetical protein